MYLLILGLSNAYELLSIKFTSHYVSINSNSGNNTVNGSITFTSHYVSINSL